MGLNTYETQIYQGFAILACIALLGWMGSNLKRKIVIQVERRVPAFAGSQEDFSHFVIITNVEKKPLPAGMLLYESIDFPVPDKKTFLAELERFRRSPEKMNPFIRYSMARVITWKRLLRSQGTAFTNGCPIPILKPGESTTLRVSSTGRSRGRLHFTGVKVLNPDPTGLFYSVSSIACRSSMTLLPKQHSVGLINLRGKSRYEQGGVALAAVLGESEEFVSMREYRPGDPLRRIHWKSWARTGQPVVKEFQNEQYVRHALILDTFATPILEPIFEEALQAASSFVCNISTQEALLDLMFIGDKSYRFTVGRGTDLTSSMLEILACVRSSESGIDQLENLILRHIETMSTAIIIVLGWDAPRQKLVRRLQQLNVPLLVLAYARRAKDKFDFIDFAADKCTFKQVNPGDTPRVLTTL